jgi:hypothetical protein
MNNVVPRVSAFVVILVLMLTTQVSIVRPAKASARSLATPLPLTCPGSPAPTVCVYGYAYWNGSPVAGATVKIDSLYGTLNTMTAAGGLSSSPYFYAALSSPPLLISTDRKSVV